MRAPPCRAASAVLVLLLLPFVFAARLPFRHHTLLSDALPMPNVAHQVDPLNRVPPEFNINSGGPAVGRFVADNPVWLVGLTSVLDLPNVPIGGAEEKNQPMYTSHRFGNDASSWGYDIPVMEPGTYGCTVHFAETFSDAFMTGRRVFDLLLSTTHGDPVIFDDIDIFSELKGAEFTALTKTAVDLVIPGILSIRVTPSVGDAIISGLTCERTGDLPDGVDPDWETSPTIPTDAAPNTDPGTEEGMGDGVVIVGTEININAGGPELGRFLAEDYNWIRGTTSFWGGPEGVEIGGAEEKNAPALISHRFGVDGAQWGYAIPIATSGKYHCSLHFAETDSSSFITGARVFNILIQDRAMNDVDIFRDAGEARFTSVVKTFLNLNIGNELVISLVPIKGDAFLSAITCERFADLDPEDLAALPSTSPEPLVTESPMPEETTAETLEPVASESPSPNAVATPPVVIVVPSISPDPFSPTPVPTPVVVETPGSDESPAVIQASPMVLPSPPASDPLPSPLAAPSASTEVEESPEASAEALSFLLDNPIPIGTNEISVNYELTGTVTAGSDFTEGMKSALLDVSGGASGVASKWAMVSLLNADSDPSDGRQDVDLDRTYNMDLQAVYNEGEEEQGLEDYRSFINDGDVNTELATKGIDNFEVVFRSEPNLNAVGADDTADVASTSNTSTLVGSIVGGILALLAVIALVAFFVVRRKRGNENDAAAFDAPPPAMTESESSVMERSETAASVEYLDDDSTFTAATSRAGDHEDQVAYDKDVFGRGTAAGAAHGTS